VFWYCDSLTDVYYSGNEEEWNAISIGDDNGDLTNATIHYGSGGSTATVPPIPIEPDKPHNGHNISVLQFNKYDTDTKSVGFYDDLFVMYDVTENTDTSFLNILNDIKGKYVLVESAPYSEPKFNEELYSIKLIDETNIGKLESVSDVAAVIDGKVYTTAKNMNETAGLYINQKVMYHVIDGIIVDITPMMEQSGIFEKWDKEKSEVVIGGETYSTNYKTDMSFTNNLEDLIGTNVIFFTAKYSNGPVMNILFSETKTGLFKNYNSNDKTITIDENTYPIRR